MATPESGAAIEVLADMISAEDIAVLNLLRSEQPTKGVLSPEELLAIDRAIDLARMVHAVSTGETPEGVGIQKKVIDAILKN